MPPWTRSALIFVAALGSLGATRAFCQPFSDPGLGLGGHIALSPSTADRPSLVTGGLNARARLTGNLGLEGLLSYRREELSVAGEPVLRLQEIPVQLSALLFFLPTSRVQPYVLFGISYSYVRTEGLGSNAPAGRTTENKFGFHAGAGADVRVARRVSIFAEARYVLVDVDAAAALEKTHGKPPSTNYANVGLGLLLYF